MPACASRGRMLALALLCCCVAAVAGPAAHAEARSRTIDLTCLALAQFDFAPSLNNTSTSASFSGLASTCISPNGKYKRLHSAVVFGTDGVTATGCAPLFLQILGGNNTLFWDDGSTSRFRIDISTDPRTRKLGFNALLTEGTMAGSRISGIPLLVAQKGLCGLRGVRSFAIEGTVTFTH